MKNVKWDIEKVKTIVATTNSLSAALKKLSIAPTHINYDKLRFIIDKYEIPTDHFSYAKNTGRLSKGKITFNKEELLEAVSKSTSIARVFHYLNMSYRVRTFQQYKNAINDWNIDTSHFNSKKNPKLQLTDILVNNGPRYTTSRLRQRLIEEGLMEARCAICFANEWNGLAIPLELDHINGNNIDNRIENLRIICPNCHSQTDTFCGRNKKLSPKVMKEFNIDPNLSLFDQKQFLETEMFKVKEASNILKQIDKESRKVLPLCLECGEYTKQYDSKVCKGCYNKDRNKHQTPYNRPTKVPHPSKEELQKMLWEKATVQIAKEFGVSDKAIEKWAKKYGCTKPPRGYWAKVAAGQLG